MMSGFPRIFLQLVQVEVHLQQRQGKAAEGGQDEARRRRGLSQWELLRKMLVVSSPVSRARNFSWLVSWQAKAMETEEQQKKKKRTFVAFRGLGYRKEQLAQTSSFPRRFSNRSPPLLSMFQGNPAESCHSACRLLEQECLWLAHGSVMRSLIWLCFSYPLIKSARLLDHARPSGLATTSQRLACVRKLQQRPAGRVVYTIQRPATRNPSPPIVRIPSEAQFCGESLKNAAFKGPGVVDVPKGDGYLETPLLMICSVGSHG